jgi:hypothetical protein
MPRKVGRPALDPHDSSSVSVHLRLPANVYDKLYTAARLVRVSVPELVRQRIVGPRPPRNRDGDDDDG